jgi:hypothetical protein
MKNLIIIFSIVIIFAFLGACNNSTPFASNELPPSPAATKTLPPAITSTPSQIPELYEVIEVATTLDFRRNDKIYTVTIAKAHFNLINRDLYNSLTPPPILPTPSDSIVYRAKIKEVSDLDNDGEQEYTVLLDECKDWDCNDYVSYIKIYKYNPEKDEYYVFNKFETEPEEIKPEIIY